MKWLLIIFTLTATTLQAQEPGDLYLGFSTVDATGENKFDFDQFKEKLEIAYISRPSAGAFVSSVESKSAPVQFGDIIFMVEKEKVKSSDDFQRVSENLKIDETVKMRIRRPVQKSKSGKFKWDTMTVHLTPKTYLEYVKGKLNIEVKDSQFGKLNVYSHSGLKDYGTNLNLRIFATKTENPDARLLLKFNYLDRDWISLRKIVVTTEKNVYTITPERGDVAFKAIDNGLVTESYLTADTTLIEDISRSNKIEVLYVGTDRAKEFEIGEKTRKKLNEVFMVFDSMKSK